MDTTDRDLPLQELFVKGFRVGFRMGMEPNRWVINWPSTSESFDPDTMVNESRLLHGDPTTTFDRIRIAPQSYGVRFALSPTITKVDYASGFETRKVVHHAMVLLAKKHAYNFVGAERHITAL